ncbi:hypothetical protein Lser_V15G15788 [Lactuca serriola]
MGFDSLLPAPVSTDSSGPGVNCPNPLVDDASKKIRKPYTITKSRQNWTDIEHDKFLEALHLFDRDWKKIEAFVGSKTAIQIRSHAQKYFLKVQKSGANEHVPPPRPKRKAAHPYPHKAPKNGGISQSASEDIVLRESYLWPTNGGLSTWTYNDVATNDVATQDDVRSSHNCSSSSTGETNNRQDLKQKTTGRVMPDFPKVYRFIGRMFDPNESNHLQNLKMMDPVDVETVVLLMKNLCANLKSPQFEDYKRVFSSYDEGTGKVASSGPFQVLSGSAIRSS